MDELVGKSTASLLSLMTCKTTMQNKLYFYTFPSAYNAERPMLKIGQTSQEDVQIRIAQQMGTATPEKPELMGQFEANFTDHEFHRFLLSRGIEKPNGAGTEWWISSEGPSLHLRLGE